MENSFYNDGYTAAGSSSTLQLMNSSLPTPWWIVQQQYPIVQIHTSLATMTSLSMSTRMIVLNILITTKTLQALAAKGVIENVVTDYVRKCFFPQYMAKQIQTPFFLLNTAYDSWQGFVEFVITKLDPIILTNQKTNNKRCLFWKWLCTSSCQNPCCGGCPTCIPCTSASIEKCCCSRSCLCSCSSQKCYPSQPFCCGCLSQNCGGSCKSSCCCGWLLTNFCPH